MSLDQAVEYVEKLQAFVEALNKAHGPDSFAIETGRKFDKVYDKAAHAGRYMVDRNSWIIYGIKSWAQHNPRRMFGTLKDVAQYDWSGVVGSAIVGTEAHKTHVATEAIIASQYAKRGRPKKVVAP